MIRPVQPQDVKYITDIYNEYILNSTYTFETEPISEDEMRLRIAEIFPHFPFFVCETDHKVVGYCYALLYRRHRFRSQYPAWRGRLAIILPNPGAQNRYDPRHIPACRLQPEGFS